MEEGTSAIIDGMDRRLNDPASIDLLHLRVGEILLAGMRENIETQGHGGWQPLAPKTVGLKAVRGFSSPSTALVATGELYESLEEGHAHNVLTVTTEGVEAGTSDPVGAYHTQRDGGGGRVPKRDFTETSDETMQEVRKTFAAWLVGDLT